MSKHEKYEDEDLDILGSGPKKEELRLNSHQRYAAKKELERNTCAAGDGEVIGLIEEDRIISAYTQQEIEDLYGKMEYPPARRDKAFVDKWAIFLPQILGRSNFSEIHIEGLRILCETFVDLDFVTEFIRTKGLTYKAINRSGSGIYRVYPEVAIQKSLRAQVISMSKSMSLYPKSPKMKPADPTPSEQQDWE